MNATFIIPDGLKNWNCEISDPELRIRIVYANGALTVSGEAHAASATGGGCAGGGGGGRWILEGEKNYE